MPQIGVHGIAGLVGTRYILRNLPLAPDAKGVLIFGFVIGNLLPDADTVVSAAVYPYAPELAMALHRGFSHSLAAMLFLVAWFYLLGFWLNKPLLGSLGWGLSLGVAAHIVLDLFMWFSPVEVLWPLGFWGIPSVVDLWSNFQPPPVVTRLLGAAEFAAIWWFYAQLQQLAAATGNLQILPMLARLTCTAAACFSLYTLLALAVPNPYFDLLLYFSLGLFFFPVTFYLPLYLRPCLESWAVNELPDPTA